jgi:hypothetical protein
MGEHPLCGICDDTRSRTDKRTDTVSTYEVLFLTLQKIPKKFRLYRDMKPYDIVNAQIHAFFICSGRQMISFMPGTLHPRGKGP